MFNIGLVELLIIIFFLVVFVKPEDIPKISRYIGLFYRKINSYIFNIKHELTNISIDHKPDISIDHKPEKILKSKKKKINSK